MDFNALIVGRELARRKFFSFSAHTAFPAMQIQYIGPATYAKITVAAGGDITIHADDVDGATTVYASFDLSTPAAARNTYGELAQEINSYEYLRCFLIGVLPSESTDNTLAALSSTSIATDTGLTLYIDQAVLLDVGFAITANSFTSRPTTGWAGKYVGWCRDSKEYVNRLHYINLSITQTNAGTTKVYNVNDVTGTETVIWSNAYVSATAEEHGSSPTPAEAFLVASPGCRLVVKFDAVDNAATAATVFGIGSTQSLYGDIAAPAGYSGCTS